MGTKNLHIAMYPWFAMGHLTPFLSISNKLAERGHRITFFLPPKTRFQLQQNNLHPHLITFIPLTIPHVDGLPPGAETTADVPYSMLSHLFTAMDLARPQIEQHLIDLKPDIVFFDFSYWLPELLRQLGLKIKSLLFYTVSPATTGFLLSRHKAENPFDYKEALPPFPSSIKLRAHEARAFARFSKIERGRGVTFLERLLSSLDDCDAIGFKTCKELEGPFCDYLEALMRKPVILAGPLLPVLLNSKLEEKWGKWLGEFESGTVIYAAFGSECILTREQFQEVLLGLELTGLPFFAALKNPAEVETIESAFPQGFAERMIMKGRGVVYGGWVQQPLILKHPSVGCFVTHCGSGSLTEALVSECQLVLLPHVGDQFINARLMGRYLKVGVEVEKGDEDGLFTKEGVCKAVKSVMDEDSELGKEVKTNHAKWRQFFSTEGLESSYMDSFVHKLHELLD